MKPQRSLLSIAMAMVILVSLCAVVSTTSVSAAPSSAKATTSKLVSTSVSAAPRSGANFQPSTGLVGAPAGVVGAPASCSYDPNTYELFIRGTDNALWWRHWTSTTGWSAWQSLGGIITSSPGAASSGSGRLTVAARGTDGALWRRFTTDGGTIWAPWSSRGGRLLEGTGPAVVSMDTGIKYFVTGTDNALWWSSATSWVSLGGYLTSSPSAASSTGESIAVAARGGDGALYVKLTSTGGAIWTTNWVYGGGQILDGTGPAVVSPGGLYYYLVIGTNHALYRYSGASSWTSLSGYLTSSPAACSHTAGTIDVFAVGSDGDIWGRWSTNGGSSWNPWYEAISL